MIAPTLILAILIGNSLPERVACCASGCVELAPREERALETILDDPKLSGAIVSAYVCDLQGRVLIERNSATHVMPASNMKLLSSTFAVHELGPDYHPETRVWKQPNCTVVWTDGDPTMSYAKWTQIRDSLKLDPTLAVHVIEPYDAGFLGDWDYGDLPNKYAAPVSALTIDRNSFEVWCKGGKVVGVPSSYGNSIEIVPGSAPARVEFDPFKSLITVKGKLPAIDRRLDTLSIPDPEVEIARILGCELIRVKEAPADPPTLTVQGPTLMDIVGLCLPPSDNNLAENLLLMGGGAKGDLGDDPYGTATARETRFLVRDVGISPADLKVEDGSGLTRHDFVTTRALGQLLVWEAHQKTGEAYRACLSKSGVKGTLAHRLQDVDFQGKTGSLDMVSALSGYLKTKSGKDLVVSVVLNEYGCSGGDAIGVIDKFVRQVAASVEAQDR